MIPFRGLRRLEMVKMLSVRRFQKLLAGYFILAGFVVFIYFYFYGSEVNSRTTSRDMPFITELNESKRSMLPLMAEEEIEFLKKVDENLRAIMSQGNSDLLDAELQMMMEALQRSRDRNTVAAGVVEGNTSMMEPDYFLRSIAYTESYTPPTQVMPTSPPRTQNDVTDTTKVKGDVYYGLDKKGAVYEDFMADYEDESLYEIPHIIHQTWDTDVIPAQVANFVSSWLRFNPFWVHWFWTDRGFTSLLLRHFPEYYDVYRRYEHRVNKADMRKYFLLYKEGGLVADLDLECIRRFDDSLLDSQCILAREPDVHQVLIYDDPEMEYVTPAFMACRAEHPFFKFVIDNLRPYAEKAHGMEWDDQVLNGTGTVFLSQVYHEYKQRFDASDIYLAPAELFMPAYDPAYETRLRVKCNGYKLDESLSSRQKAMCERLEQTSFRDLGKSRAYTLHHWSRTWSEQHQQDTDVINVKNVLPSITLFDR